MCRKRPGILSTEQVFFVISWLSEVNIQLMRNKIMSKLPKAVKSLKPSTNSHKVKRKLLLHYFDSNILFSFNTTFSQERHKSHHEPHPVCSYCLLVVGALLNSFNPSWHIGLLNRGSGASWGPCWTEFSNLNLNLNPYHLLFSFQEFHNSSPNNLALLFHTCVLCFMLSYSEIFASIVSLKFMWKWSSCLYVCSFIVVVQYFPWFTFYFLLFKTRYHTLPYPKTKENKIWSTT